jgi:hypothetical protein
VRLRPAHCPRIVRLEVRVRRNENTVRAEPARDCFTLLGAATRAPSYISASIVRVSIPLAAPVTIATLAFTMPIRVVAVARRSAARAGESNRVAHAFYSRSQVKNLDSLHYFDIR